MKKNRPDLYRKLGISVLCPLFAAIFLTVGSAPAATRYVDVNCASPTPPYTSWATAATTIQDAVDAAAPGDEVVVTNGVYDIGNKFTWGGGQRRVAVDKPLTILGANGPDSTVIDGGGSMGCAYLVDGSFLSGFTLTNGLMYDNYYRFAGSGGGVSAQSSRAVVSNCFLVGNYGSYYGGGAFNTTLINCTLSNNFASWGGGAFGGSLINCVLTENRAAYGGGASSNTLDRCTLVGNHCFNDGGGAYYAVLKHSDLIYNSSRFGGGIYGGAATNCTFESNSSGRGGGAYLATLSHCMLGDNYAEGSNGGGGGAYQSTLHACVLIHNKAGGTGGGSVSSKLNNCLLIANMAYAFGGGAGSGLLTNCTMVGNWARDGGGGAYGGRLQNCILYYNTASRGSNYFVATMNYCCTSPMPTNGVGNITSEPSFMTNASVYQAVQYFDWVPWTYYPWTGLRLQSDTPCIEAGNNIYVTTSTDLAGNPRISGGTVDMGAYEFAFTPEMNLARSILLVEDASMDSKNKQPLLATLNAALASLTRGNSVVGDNQLHAFQNKVRAQISPVDPALADVLMQTAQEVINGLQP